MFCSIVRKPKKKLKFIFNTNKNERLNSKRIEQKENFKNNHEQNKISEAVFKYERITYKQRKKLFKENRTLTIFLQKIKVNMEN